MKLWRNCHECNGYPCYHRDKENSGMVDFYQRPYDRGRHPGHHRASDCGKDRKSTRLNSSHQIISYAVFCLKKKKRRLNSLHPTSHPPRSCCKRQHQQVPNTYARRQRRFGQSPSSTYTPPPPLTPPPTSTPP